MHDWSPGNVLAWMEQVFVLASLGALLPLVFRVRHPSTRLAYCHALLAICLALPWIEPWRAAKPDGGAAWLTASWVVWLIAVGAAAKLGWLFVGLWRIRKCRISSMPMYPIPESVRAAAAVTQADALFCVSGEVPGPVMLGWLTPVVLLPESFLSLQEDAQCGVACHELLHVRRHDWLVTVMEELAGAVLWFNPAIWPLLAQTRLAREQLVDAEVVRLTAAREPYIDALLTIARGGSALDLAPAPLFLRRRHLTQRVHSLLKDGVASPLRLISSYTTIAIMLAASGWFSMSAFPLVGRATAANIAGNEIAAEVPAPPVVKIEPTTPAVAAPKEAASQEILAETPLYIPSAAIPPDAHELVTGGVRILTAAEATSARAWLERARANARLATAGMPPYRSEVSFTASGEAQQTGPGRLTEMRMPGMSRWTAELGEFSVIRWTGEGLAVEDKHAATVPVRVLALRQAIHWEVQNPLGQRIRSAAAQWNGRAVTCLLFSNMQGEAILAQARLWEEDEYCLDDSSGLLQIASIAPGTYTVYDYGGNLKFHGHAMADRITIYTHGKVDADAQLTIADLTEADGSLLTPQPGAEGPVVALRAPARFPFRAPNPAPSKLVQPVIVRAEIDGEGKVVEAELCAASDLTLADAALALVKRSRFRHQAWTQYQAFINVRFMPSAK